MEENNSQPSKYDAALAKYNTNLNDADIQARVAELIKKKVPENNTEDVKKFLFNCIDLTTLNSTDSDESVMHFTEKVNQFDDEYPDLKNVAAICVYPNFAAIVKNTLEVDGVNIACVSGGFPSSQTFIEVKVAETALAITDGADEIDIVISIGKFLSGDYEGMCEEIVELKEVCKEHHLKVILETGALKSASNIKKASILSMYSGADFIKTSTGKQQPAATPEAAYVMCEAIKEYYQKTGNKIGFKPAGGINTVNDAVVYYTIVKEVLGEEWLNNQLFRLGTSRLANLLLSDIKGEEHMDYFRPEGDEMGANLNAYYPRPIIGSKQNQQVQSRYLQNAAYIRLKNIQIGYTLPKAWIQKANLEKVRLFFSGDNLWTGTKMSKNFDPELIYQNGMSYPLSYTLSCGINITL